ncbi:MFS transporter [Clostridium saudiense]|uniref:MFS transporter n=1 Tax=Clostridium saudiense TaxID=1414720 RepID=A0ABS2FFZ3_9CLOT|nr:MFS transporter [Clostridium saudiense]MBM6819480.1 MFS transporter [Clostridium saudiense]
MFSLLLAVIYLAFISLGLPDSLLGSVWPTIYQDFNVPVSYAGAIFMIISAGTIFSSLQSDRLTKSLGTGKVTAVSVLMTAVALFGFSISHSYWMLVLWAIPYGLGAGSVDASLNNYVALHYKSHHMSWLHCMWGVGASIGPYIMSFALVNGQTWNMGYRYISLIQVALTIIIMLSLPLWKKRPVISDIQEAENGKDKVLTLKEIFNIPGAKQLMLMFFCYCALEQTAGLWASSYLVLQHGFDLEVATSYGSLFFIGITVGRAISGFITMKLNDKQMIYLGEGLILIGIILMCLPLGHQVALIGLVTIGLGCAPIYPCIIHSTPSNFGKDKSQAIIGVQMASAYVGNLLMPPLFGIIANHISAIFFPIYLLLILIVMVVMHIKLNNSVSKNILIN